MNSSILRHWKSELKYLGLAYRNRMFLYEPPGERQSLQLGVSIQKSTRDARSKINPSVLFTNPCVDDAGAELLLLGNLRPDGIYLHVATSSWWPEEALPEALTCLGKFAIPWFQKVGRPAYLAEVLETAIRERRSVVDIVEPLPESMTALPWAPEAPRRVGSTQFYEAAVLHYLNGNREKAIQRTRDWLEALETTSGTDHAGRRKALAQLAKLKEVTRPS